MMDSKKLEKVLMIFVCIIQVFSHITIENDEFKLIRPGGELIEGRRGASGVLVGKHFIIFGGINTKGRYLSDLYHYDIINNKMFEG